MSGRLCHDVKTRRLIFNFNVFTWQGQCKTIQYTEQAYLKLKKKIKTQKVLFLKNTAMVICDIFSIGPEAQPGGSQRREAFSVTCSDSIII